MIFPMTDYARATTGIDHVANFFLLTKAENVFFGDNHEKWKFKMQGIGLVRFNFFSVLFSRECPSYISMFDSVARNFLFRSLAICL